MRVDFTKHSKGEPPKAKQQSRIFRLHGDTRKDEYSWMQEEGPATAAYFKAENKYAESTLKPLSKLQKKLYKEIKSRIKEDDISVPVQDGPYLYYTRVEKGRQYPLHCRKRGEKGKEEIILDENKLAKGTTFFSLGAFEVSPDHSLLAYAIDTKGNEDHTLYIKNLATGKLLPEVIHSVSAGEWSFDGAYLFYAQEQHPFPPRKVFRHRLGDSAKNDVLVFEEKDDQFYVSIGKSRSRQYLFITVANFDCTEVHVLSSQDPLGTFVCLAPRMKKIKYMVEHHEDSFYILTNERAVNYKIMRTSVSKPFKDSWKPWVAHNPKRALTGFMPYKTFCALSARESGSEWLFTSEYKPSFSRVVLPEAEHMLSVSDDIEYEESFVRYVYSSFLTPKSVYDYDVTKKTTVLRKINKVPRYEKKNFVSERIWVRSGATKVPVSICYKKGTQLDGSAPCLMQFYGSYGITYDPTFSVAQLSLLERGFVVAIAHPRGGGEMGWKWHEDAKLLTKHRTYQDVIACADALVAKKYCARSKLAITGGSAGGMTAGAVLNMRPDLCAAAVVYVPNADTVASMLDTKLGGTVLHYDELGDPRKKEEYFYLKKWSPYENVKSAHYPSLLVRASQFDIRTPAWEAAKWIARLRAKASGNNTFLFKIEMHGGHGGKSGRYEWIKERAWDYAYVLQTLKTPSRTVR